MEFFGREVREPDDAVLDVTGAIGTQIGEFIRRKQAEESLQESEEQLRAMFDNASIGIAMTGVDLRYLRVNGKFAEIVGYTQEELLRMNIADVNLEENIDEMVKRRSALLDSGGTAMREKQLLRKNGTLIWVSMVTSVIRSKDGAPRYFLSVIQDISETRRAAAALKESEEQFRQLAGNIPQVFWIADALQKQTIYISPACKDLTGIEAEQLMRSGKTLMQCVHPEDRRRVYRARRMAPAGTYNETYRVVHTDGSVRWVQDRAFPVESREGSLYRIAGIVEDVTERKLAEERLVQLAHFDGLTGLPNRALFYDRLGHAVAQARRNNRVMGVMFIDVDRFKYVNDTMGHDAGDDLLKIIARRLMDAVRSDDTVGRLGGDEFAIVLNTLTAADDAALVARKIIETLNQPFLINGSEITVSGSIGVTLFPTDSTEPDDLIKNADTAMYRAKEMGRNTFQFYRPEMNAHVLQILSLENELRRAHEKNEFVLHYQPKVDVASGEIIGAEALIRWQHPERGLVPAADFIPVLEESGLVVQVGKWVLQEVCRQLKNWERASLRLVPIALNLSARQFLAPDLGAYIERTLKEHSIEPGLIEFEITESSIMSNAEEAIRTLEYLEGARRRDCDRRLRHRLFQPRLSQALPDQGAEDRPLVRARHHHRRGRRDDHARHHHDGAQSRAARHCGRRGDRRPAQVSREQRVRRSAGIPVFAAGVRFRLRNEVRGRERRDICRRHRLALGSLPTTDATALRGARTSFSTFARFAISDLMCAANSAGVSPITR